MKQSAHLHKHFFEEDSTTSNSRESGFRFKEEQLSRESSSSPVLEDDARVKVQMMFERSYCPTHVLSRGKEFELIAQFCRQATAGKIKSRCLIATGMPGAGKTLICSRAIATIEKTKTVALNAEICKDLKQFILAVETQLYEGKKPTTANSVKKLLSRLTSEPLKLPTIVLVDELDGLFSKTDEALLQIFELFTHPRSKLTLVGTSNNMEFIERISVKFQTSLPEIRNVVFSAYSSDQFEEILKMRLEDIEEETGVKICFEERSLRYISSKMYNAKGGDIRKVFIEVQKAVKAVIYKEAQPKKEYTVSFEEVAKVCSQLVPTKRNAELLKVMTLQEQLTLIGLYTLFKETDSLQVDLQQLMKQIKWVTESLSMDCPNQPSISQKLQFLESYGFVALKSAKNKLFVTIKVLSADIEEAFEEHALFNRFFKP